MPETPLSRIVPFGGPRKPLVLQVFFGLEGADQNRTGVAVQTDETPAKPGFPSLGSYRFLLPRVAT